MKNVIFTYKYVALLLTLFCTVATEKSIAQDRFALLGDSIIANHLRADSIIQSVLRTDSVTIDSIYRNQVSLSPDSSRAAMKRSYNEITGNIKPFKPDPTKATWLAIVIPGGGQIYNRKYWKLPIVYGGFVGCLYAYNWNNQMYSDYRQAYLDIMDSDPNSDSYKDFFRPGYNFDDNMEYITGLFKKRKDRYRRWRDLSVFAFIGVYVLSVIDAYVDAQLASFDISENLNITVEPGIMNNNYGRMDKNYYGINCNINF